MSESKFGIGLSHSLKGWRVKELAPSRRILYALQCMQSRNALVQRARHGMYVGTQPEKQVTGTQSTSRDNGITKHNIH